jgi:hypothetical protein
MSLFDSLNTGQSELNKLTELVREFYLDGLTEDQVITALTVDATKHFGRQLKKWELDRIRYIALGEKIKLVERGKLTKEE